MNALNLMRPRKQMPWLSFLFLVGRLRSAANLRTSAFVRWPMGKRVLLSCCWVSVARKYVWSLTGSGDRMSVYMPSFCLVCA